MRRWWEESDPPFSKTDRWRRSEEATKRRNMQRHCAIDFLYHGDQKQDHAKRCVFPSDPCSREYDAYPTPEAAPDPRLYEGTGIGAIYGYSDEHAYQLAGWNLTTRHTRKETYDNA